MLAPLKVVSSSNLLPLNPSEIGLHKKAMALCSQHRKIEWEIVKTLQKIDRLKMHRKFGATSLFKYAVEVLGLSESGAYTLISVSRKAAQIPELARAIKEERLTANKASRIVAAITPDNAKKLIAFAESNSKRVVDQEVAKLNPSAIQREIVRPVSGTEAEVTITVSNELLRKIRRAQSLLAKTGAIPTIAETLDKISDDFLVKNDPVVRAERRSNRQKLCPDRVTLKGTTSAAKGLPLTLAQKDAVFKRDQGRCTFKDLQGRRCENESWLHIHHIRPVSLGGGNDLENLTTLCSSHHDLIHQKDFNLDRQKNFLRSPQVRYGNLKY